MQNAAAKMAALPAERPKFSPFLSDLGAKMAGPATCSGDPAVPEKTHEPGNDFTGCVGG